jgi:hypothetical protein
MELTISFFIISRTQYSRALEHILQTVPPALLLRDDVEIFETLDLVSKYAGMCVI